MKKMFIAAVLIVSGLLSACNQLTQYSVSEQEINQALQKRNHCRSCDRPALSSPLRDLIADKEWNSRASLEALLKMFEEELVVAVRH